MTLYANKIAKMAKITQESHTKKVRILISNICVIRDMSPGIRNCLSIEDYQAEGKFNRKY